jgi:arsenate reductase
MSRRTLDLIKKKGIQPKIIEYLKSPPTAEELDRILKLLGMEPREILRTKEKEYKQNKLDNPGLTRQQLIQAMVKHPILIQRPIVLSKGKAALGRPPESVEKIL